MDFRHQFREQRSPELPSETMKREFELWEEEYNLDTLTDLTSSQIRSKELEFENRVERLVVKHNPGRLVKENPFLACSLGKPAYTPQQWEKSQEMIRTEANQIKNRFDQAEGIVTKEEKKSRQSWSVKLADAIFPDSIKLR